MLDEYQRGYSEINHFEKQLVERGIVLVKFWLHITKDEQLRRFRERQTDSAQALEDHRRGLAQPPPVERLRASGHRDGVAHQYATGAMGVGGGQRQVLRADQGLTHAG